MKNIIPKKEYKKIIDKFPIPCVDLVIKHKNQFILIKRKNKPMKNKYWLAGGRIFKNETIEHAVKRKLKEETNLKGKIKKLLGPYEFFSKEAAFNVKTGTHCLVAVALVEIKNIKQLKADKNHSNYKFFTKINKSWHHYLKQILKDSGFSY